MYLCKPDRTTIAELSEAYNKNLSTNYNGIHELTFDIPYLVNRNHKYVRNKNVDLIRGHYLIRYERGHEKEYFIITNPKNTTNNGVEVKNVQCYLLPYELNKKIIREFSGTKPLYSDVGSEGVLNETLLVKSDWTVGYIDVDIANKHRTFDVSEQSLIEFIGELSDLYDAVIIWDTINKKINFYKNENIGTNKGLYIEHGKYLKSLEENPDFDSVVTRLYVYGNEGISFASVNPTGVPFIESFDFYMYPFKRDENTREIISHSNYMTDSLCHAILDYNALLDSKQGEFTNMLERKKPIQENLQTKQNELFVLQTQLHTIEDELSSANAAQLPVDGLITQKINKLAEIASKNNEIDTIKASLKSIDDEIVVLKNTISIENNFTHEQIIERERFVNELVWSNTSIFEVDDLYEEGKKELLKVSQPRISYSIDVVDFLNVSRCQRDWDKLVLGDLVTVKYPNFGIDVLAKIISIKHGEDSNNLSIEIANAHDIKNGFMTLKELFNRTVSSSTTLDMSKFKWDKTTVNTHEIGQILENVWDATKREIEAGYNNKISIDRKGIVITDPNDPLRLLVMQNGVIGMSLDGGSRWATAINADGVHAERIIGKLLLGEKLIIGDNNGTFTINGNLLTIKDLNDKPRVKLGEYSKGVYGLQVFDKTGNQTILDENGILQTWQQNSVDNVDGYNPLTLEVFIPSETLSIKKVMLRFKLLQFRAYSQTTESGGGTYSSTDGGGGAYTSTGSGGGTYGSTDSGGGTFSSTESGGSAIVTSGDSGIDVIYGTAQTDPAAGHSHTFRDVIGHKHNISLPSHTHSFSVPSHSHMLSVPSHSHMVDIPSHSHSFTVPSHSHPIQHGIYKSTYARQLSVHINGVNRDYELGGKFDVDRHDLNITPYLVKGQWNTIDLYSSQLGRIDATVFVQALMGYNN
ncbi:MULTISPECIES: phage tail spike protein [Lysinibacillus]|uniref:phage tail spike protein n=1 Tax=Lysinibacillus TaxID=400634 RepID=UPI00214BD8F9|nr:MULTISPECIES: phage tail spike protein [Lysinibacillus]UUV25843.1 phage tail protein [Lysinibacillus sp. FN11]UYB48717.1 phage tail protein [Lysinibacillus capsici]